MIQTETFGEENVSTSVGWANNFKKLETTGRVEAEALADTMISRYPNMLASLNKNLISSMNNIEKDFGSFVGVQYDRNAGKFTIKTTDDLEAKILDARKEVASRRFSSFAQKRLDELEGLRSGGHIAGIRTAVKQLNQVLSLVETTNSHDGVLSDLNGKQVRQFAVIRSISGIPSVGQDTLGELLSVKREAIQKANTIQPDSFDETLEKTQKEVVRQTAELQVETQRKRAVRRGKSGKLEFAK